MGRRADGRYEPADLTAVAEEPLGGRFCIQGLDDFSPRDLDSFWEARKRFADGESREAPVMFLGISTKDVCNFNCIFCYGPEFRADPADGLAVEAQIRLIDEAADLGARSVIFCGNGEPTMDPDLMPMVAHTHSRGLRSIVFTNGFVFGQDEACRQTHGMAADELLVELYECGAALVVHIESLEEKTYEAVTRVPRSFEVMQKAIHSIERVGFTEEAGRANGRRVTRLAISTIAMKPNLLQLPALRRFAHARNAQYLCKFPSFLGRATANRRLLFRPDEDATIWLRENYVRRISEKPESITVDGLHCGAWHYGIVVANNGDVRFCYSAPCDSSNWIGNATQAPLAELLQRREQVFRAQLERGVACPVKTQWYRTKRDGDE